MTMISNVMIFFISGMLIFKFSFTNITDNFVFLFLKLLIPLHTLLRIQKTFSCNLYLYIHHAYFLCFLNEDIEDNGKHDEICSPTFVVDEFS